MHQRTIAEAIENYRTLQRTFLEAGLDDDTRRGRARPRRSGRGHQAAKNARIQDPRRRARLALRGLADRRRRRLRAAGRALTPTSSQRASRLPRAARLARRRLVAVRPFRRTAYTLLVLDATAAQAGAAIAARERGCGCSAQNPGSASTRSRAALRSAPRADPSRSVRRLAWPPVERRR